MGNRSKKGSRTGKEKLPGRDDPTFTEPPAAERRSMSREELIHKLEAYHPVNEQEEKDQAIILEMLKTQEDIFRRENLTAHMTASAWIVNPARTKVLMAYHNLYDSWAWLGGHADGEEDLLAVAVREAREESGVDHVRPLLKDVFSVEILTVDGHEKRGQYVPSHLHLNVTWLLEADDTEPTRVRKGENQAVTWFTPEEAVARSTEPWFRERIYGKLNRKLGF